MKLIAQDGIGEMSAYSFIVTAPVVAAVLAFSTSIASAQASPAAPQPGDVFRDCETCPEMVALPPDTYWMGATDEDRKIPYVELDVAQELPRHKVKIGYSFAIGRFAVTVEEFAAFVAETGTAVGGECVIAVPYRGPWKGQFIGEISPNAELHERGDGGDARVVFADFRKPGHEVTGRHPASCISRNEATAYLAWLSEKTGRQYRFPTEAEWEYATRAGEELPFFWGGPQHEACAYANLSDEAGGFGLDADCAEDTPRPFTSPVGSFRPNAWGLFDTVGNTFEFLEDCYFPNYEGAPADGSPWMDSDLHTDWLRPDGRCLAFGLRGYDIGSRSMQLRSAARCGIVDDEDERYSTWGMRVAVSLSDSAWDLVRR